MGTIVMKMLQNNTKKLKLCFDAITLLLLIFLLAISRMIFFLLSLSPISSISLKNLKNGLIDFNEYDIMVKYSNQCVMHFYTVLLFYVFSFIYTTNRWAKMSLSSSVTDLKL